MRCQPSVMMEEKGSVMRDKIIPGACDVSFTSFRSDPMITALDLGRGAGTIQRIPFLGKEVMRHAHIWHVASAEPGMSKFYVDANPKISISILAAGAKS